MASPTPAAVPKDKREHATTPSPNKKTETETVKTPTKQVWVNINVNVNYQKFDFQNAKPEPVPESPKSEEQKPQRNAEHKTSPPVVSLRNSVSRFFRQLSLNSGFAERKPRTENAFQNATQNEKWTKRASWDQRHAFNAVRGSQKASNQNATLSKSIARSGTGV